MRDMLKHSIVHTKYKCSTNLQYSEILYQFLQHLLITCCVGIRFEHKAYIELEGISHICIWVRHMNRATQYFVPKGLPRKQRRQNLLEKSPWTKLNFCIKLGLF